MHGLNGSTGKFEITAGNSSSTQIEIEIIG